MFAAILVCGATAVITACKGTASQEELSAQQVQKTELIRTSQSWDGVELPDYFQGRPELVAMKYVFPPDRSWVGTTTPSSTTASCSRAS